MQDRPSIGVNQGFKETNLTSAQDSSIGTKLKAKLSAIRQFTGSLEEILVAIFLYVILLSAVLQSLFRDELLAWLRSILEHTY